MLINGYAIEPGSNLFAANLSSAELTNASLQAANLCSASLQGATLEGVLGVNYFSPSATIRIPDRFLVFGDAVPG